MFLTGPALSDAIRRVFGGRGLNCAVAFWGSGSADCIKAAGGNLADSRIVCDLSMGGCWPNALEELGAPNNERIRRRDGLHAKVYISDAGMVVGSPNASANGIGFNQKDAIWLEAGTFHEPKSQAWDQAISWFDALFDGATIVDTAALADARRRWRPTLGVAGLPVREGSLLDLVRNDPDQFAAIGFVLVRGYTTKREREAARIELKKQSNVKEADVDQWLDDDIYTGWDETEVRRWPASFIEFWLKPRGKLSVCGRQVRFFEPKTGSIFSEENWATIQSQLPPNVPTVEDIERKDALMAAELLGDEYEGLLYSASDLSKALIERSSRAS